MKKVISGNEAVAWGVYEAGCKVAAAYPGTPSTEILETISKFKNEIYCQWACNEKVAAEIAAGAAIGGVRAFAAMKHVGVNVAADPLFTMGYAGVNAGFVIVSADDPGCHSSQNEQDNRWYAPHAKLIMLEPTDAQECKDFTVAAFQLSEQFDTPVFLRMTTRICHSKGIVTKGIKQASPIVPYVRKADKYAMLPGVARNRHLARENILKDVEKYASICPYNRIEWAKDRKIGIITNGISYQYAKEVFGTEASYLKLGLTYPFPKELVSRFASQVETLYVIEEGDPFLEGMVKELGFSCIGKEKIPMCGELNAQIIRESLLGEHKHNLFQLSSRVPARPPVLCAGCPHRGFFFALSKHRDKIVPVGDIGCYSLGVNAPFFGFDYSICMGSGFSSLIGLQKALEAQHDSRKAFGMLGDSTFYHSGITSLIDIVTTESNVIACVLDNSITAMTGHQENPGTAYNLMGYPSPSVDIETVVRAVGLDDDHIRIVDPLDITSVEQAIEAGYAAHGPFVIITKRPCALIKEVAKRNAGVYCKVNPELCKSCKACMKIACPAISFVDGKAVIADQVSCTGCGLCMSQCKFGAIERVG